MDRSELLFSLNRYQTTFKEENEFIPRFKSLLVNFQNCYERSLLSGHMTASAWIIDDKKSSVLLLHHKKLNRWLQPGGHADGDENISDVAYKEAFEETGLKSLQFYSPHIFDIDIHQIPRLHHIPSHYHHDIRFLFTADINEIYTVSKESNELNWVRLDGIHGVVGSNNSIHRMVLKTNLIFK